eukprot:c16392_g1_i1 orf=107-271(+)
MSRFSHDPEVSISAFVPQALGLVNALHRALKNLRLKDKGLWSKSQVLIQVGSRP